jgi:hypothetical protein
VVTECGDRYLFVFSEHVILLGEKKTFFRFRLEMNIKQIGPLFGALLYIFFCLPYRRDRRTAEKTGNHERPESRKDRKTETTGMLEQVIRV